MKKGFISVALALLIMGRLAAQQDFAPEEATISATHAAFAAGKTTCVQLVRAYLNRIEAYDHRGAALNSIITINPKALETAAEMDRLAAADKFRSRPLHCIPVILKDNYDTADMPTTGGSVTLAESVPPRDAFVVKKLREAGALILAKANLMELARGGTTVSSLGGQTRNPYDLSRTPGGSSGGTGAAIAASFAITGTGSDTGQSIRSPASAQSLVGLRPTRGLISRSGIIPYSTTQDEAGPTMVRSKIPNLDDLTRNIQLPHYESKIAFNNYLARLGPRAPVKTLAEFIARGEFHKSLRPELEADEQVVDGLNDPEYKNRVLRRNNLRQAVMTVMAENKLDAILYPHQRRLVVPIGEDQVDRNGVLSNATGFPAIAFPGGFSTPTNSAPAGVPVGIELLGPEWSEPVLIKLAYAFEQTAKIRRPPPRS